MIVYTDNSNRIELFGRHEIFVSQSAEEINRDNILSVLGNIMSKHSINAAECDFLYNYAKGNQPILQRVKKIRSDITNKVVENHALEVLTFKVGYTFGEPVQFVLYGDCDIHDAEKKNDERMSTFNELLRADNKISKDKTLGTWVYTCGIGYRMCLPTERGSDHPFDTFVLDPRQTFVAVKDDYTKKPVICGFHNRSKTQFDLYTVKSHFKISYPVDKAGNIDSSAEVEVEDTPFTLGMLPIIQYKANDQMTGCFETVLDLCESLNNIESNCIDAVEQFVQSFIWFNNCEVDKAGLDELKAVGAISTKSPAGSQANIKILSETLDQQQTNTLKESTYQSLLTIAAVPDRRTSTGGNTGQAIILGDGWVLAEAAARDFENIYKMSERAFIDIALTICSKTSSTPEKLKDLALPDVDIHFTRRMTDNLLVKTQALMNMLQAGVHPRHAFKICGLFNDPEQAYLDSEPYLQKYIAGEGTGEEIMLASDKEATSTALSNEVLDAMRKIKENLDAETAETTDEA